MTHVLVTGANGFIGKALCRALLAAGHRVTGMVRRPGTCPQGVAEWVHSTDDFVGVDAAWPMDLRPDCVIHLAARVHVMDPDVEDSDALFRATNVDGTLRVAHAAYDHGALRFVFVSSIKAIAEADEGCALREDAAAHPGDAYGRSKRDAEAALIKLRHEKRLDVVVVRPPLVYGPGVEANFRSLLNAVWMRVPLPLGAVAARRSLLFVDNLADALVRCATEPAAAAGCFHVADDDAPTVVELIDYLARCMQRPARLFPVPTALLWLAGFLTGRTPQVRRLVNNLRLETGQIRTTLGWRPPHSLHDGLALTALWYRSVRSQGASR